MTYKTIPAMTTADIENFIDWINSADNNGCTTWDGRRDWGYGMANLKGGAYFAHRVAWTLKNGPIADGLQLDHLCRNRACVNTDHLEPVTNRVNTLRGVGITAINAAKIDCKRGHELSGANLTTVNNTRRCVCCKKAYDAAPRECTVEERERFIQARADASYRSLKAA